MQLEEEYRRRWHEVNSEVTRRLNYQVHMTVAEYSYLQYLSSSDARSRVYVCACACVRACVCVCVYAGGGAEAAKGV